MAFFDDSWIQAVAFAAAWIVVSVATVTVFRRVIYRRAMASDNKIDDIIVHAAQFPIVVWLALLGAWAFLSWFALVPPEWSAPALVAIPILLALATAYTFVRVASGLMDYRASRQPSFRAVQGILEFAVRLVVYALALMFVLDHLGITITPILGALGIGGLAVALALQDTLSNFFAGLYINLDRPLREGDYVEIDGGAFGTIKGYVVDVSWRSVRIRELANNIFVIPNNKAASGIIKNYDLPEPEMSVVAQVSVAYDSDLERVEAITIDAARSVLQRAQGGVRAFQPFIRYHTFGDNGIGFSVILRVQTFVDQYLVQHEFIKELHRRFQAEGIEIPFPQRTLHVARDDTLPAILASESAPESRARGS